jgi:hypothetical protein
MLMLEEERRRGKFVMIMMMAVKKNEVGKIIIKIRTHDLSISR